MEQIRRANRLFASDSLFLREHLLIPVPIDSIDKQSLTSPTSPESVTTSNTSRINSPTAYDSENINDFFVKIDAAIVSTKEEVKKTQGSSQ